MFERKKQGDDQGPRPQELFHNTTYPYPWMIPDGRQMTFE